MIRLVRRAAATTYPITCAPLTDSGATIIPTQPVTVTVVDGAGTQAVTGTATVGPAGGLSFEVPAAAFARLDTYQVTWTSVSGDEWTDDIEVCGGRYFTLAQLRASDRAFESDRWTDSLLEAVRQAVEDTIEAPDAAGVAFVPRAARHVWRPPFTPGATSILTPHLEVHTLYTAAVDGVPLTSLQLADVVCSDAALLRRAGWATGATREISAHYSHGRGRPPAAIRRAALKLAREYAVDAGLPERATATSIGDQMFRLTIAGRDGATGLPEVDTALARFGRRRFGMAMA